VAWEIVEAISKTATIWRERGSGTEIDPGYWAVTENLHGRPFEPGTGEYLTKKAAIFWHQRSQKPWVAKGKPARTPENLRFGIRTTVMGLIFAFMGVGDEQPVVKKFESVETARAHILAGLREGCWLEKYGHYGIVWNTPMKDPRDGSMVIAGTLSKNP
jgi:hypothetical protein